MRILTFFLLGIIDCMLLSLAAHAQTAHCDSIIKYTDVRGCTRYSIGEDLFVKQWVDGQVLDTIHSNLVVLEQENDSLRRMEATAKQEHAKTKESMQRSIDLEKKDKSFIEHSLYACKQYNSDLTKSNENLQKTTAKLKEQRKGAFLIGGGVGILFSLAVGVLLN